MSPQKGKISTQKQFIAILKKDLSLLFRKKIILLIFFGPFLLIFLIVGLPALFSSTKPLFLYVCNDDLGYHGVNIGQAILANLTVYYSSNELINIQVVDSFEAVLETKDLGLYIPENFSLMAFTSIPQIFQVDATNSPYTNTYLNEAMSIASKVMTTMLANRTIPPIVAIEKTPKATGENQLLGDKAASMAFPLSYMIFLLIALNSSSNSLMGFAREKRMRTMELLLTYSFDHKILVASKAISALVASLISTTSYLLGIAVGTSLSLDSTEDYFTTFGFDFKSIGTGAIIVSFIAVVVALLIGTLITMVIDSYLTREASEKLSPLVSIGLAMLFYFNAVVNPLNVSGIMLINPFFWCYRFALLIIAGIFNWEVPFYLIMIGALLIALIYLATKGIEKERSLYQD